MSDSPCLILGCIPEDYQTFGLLSRCGFVSDQIDFDDVLCRTLGVGSRAGRDEAFEIQIERDFAAALRYVQDTPPMNQSGIARTPVGTVVVAGSGLRVVVAAGDKD